MDSGYSNHCGVCSGYVLLTAFFAVRFLLAFVMATPFTGLTLSKPRKASDVESGASESGFSAFCLALVSSLDLDLDSVSISI